MARKPMARRSIALVGRRDELARLHRTFRRAAGGDSAVVVVSGEAGVGKTTLLHAFAEAARTDGAVVLVGRCPALTVVELPYVSVADAIRTLACEVSRERMLDWFGAGCPRLAALVPELGLAPPASATSAKAADAPGALLAELSGVLRRISATELPVLIIEDLHWSDRATLDLLTLVVQATSWLGLLIMLTLRSEKVRLGEPLHGWLTELGRTAVFEHIELSPLSLVETRTLIGQVMGVPARAAFVEAIFARTAGNPFFIEELVSAHRAGTDHLPTTVRDSVLARVSALPSAARRLVAAAAVIAESGPTVPHGLLTRTLELADELATDLIRQAIAAGLLTPIGIDGYAFRHGLTSEAITADLLPVKLARWHARVAQVISAGPDVTDVPTLARAAHHWLAAGDPTQALPALVAAATAAYAAHAFATAADLYERAIVVWPTVAGPEGSAGIDEAELLERAAEAVMKGYGTERAVQLADRAIKLVDPTAQPRRAGRLHLLRGRADWAASGSSALDLAECELALDLITEPVPDRAAALVERSRLLLLDARYDEMAPLSAEAVELGRRLPDPHTEAQGLIHLAWHRCVQGDSDVALTELRHVLELGARGDDVLGFVRVFIWLSNVYHWRGEWGKAVEALKERERELIRRGVGTGDIYSFGRSAVAASYLVDLGRWVEAEARISGPLPDSAHLRLRVLVPMVALRTARGDRTEATQLAGRLKDLLSGVEDSLFVGPASEAIADCLLWADQPDRARGILVECRHRMRAYPTYSSVARLCWLGLRAEADLAERGGLVDPGVLAELRQFVESLRSLPAQALRDRAMGQLAECELSRIQEPASPILWERATASCESMGARYLALYPRWRAAQAYLRTGDRRAAADTLRAVDHVTTELGAVALQGAVRSTMRRARLPLSETKPRRDPLPYGLTTREIEVLNLVAQGATNRAIAQALFISERTVDIHVSRVLTKVGASRRTEAAFIANRIGLIDHVSRSSTTIRRSRT